MTISKLQKQKTSMRRPKSFPARSSRKSLGPDGMFGGEEMVPVTFDEREGKERHYLVPSENGGGGSLNLDACVVCDISDKWASRCSGIGCLLSFHIECLKAELGSTEEALAKPFYCPYCWFNTLALKSQLLSQALDAEKPVSEVKESVPQSQEDTTLTGDGDGNQEHSVDRRDSVGDQELQGDAYSCKGDHVHVGEGSDKSRGDSLPSAEDTDQAVEASGCRERVSTENLTDTEDDETGQKGDGSGKENDHVQQNEKPSRRRRMVLKAIDMEISLNESTNDPTGEDVTQPMAKVFKSKPVRDVSFFKNNQRRRILWTSEEEEMLEVGVETFAVEANMNMPWMKILGMGKKVFHETRTPAGLKDKWRNMIKAENQRTQQIWEMKVVKT